MIGDASRRGTRPLPRIGRTPGFPARIARGVAGVILALAPPPAIAGAGAPVASAPAGVPEPVRPPDFWFDPLAGPPLVARSERAMIATASVHASQAGLDALRDGGSAVDAAIAAQFVLNVVEPQSSGIGGGCFFLIAPRDVSQAVVIDGRESAPRAAFETMFLDSLGVPVLYYPDRVTGGLPIGVPGTLSALWEAHQRFGRLDWARLIDPAIRLAADGFPVSRRLHETIREERDRLARFPATRAVLLRDDGSALRVGERLRQPDLAATLTAIATEGPDAFYLGEIASDIVDAAASGGAGILTRDDLAGYRAVVRPPVRGRYREYDVVGVGPPSSGGIAIIEMLNILEGYDLGALGAGSAEATHLILESGKLAFADRNRYVGDADRVPVPVDSLLSKSFAARRRAWISSDAVLSAPAAPESVDVGSVGAGDGETSHLSVVDADGNMVALTTTIEQNFGSAVLVPGRGFLLNNELSDFDAVPRTGTGEPVANRPGPGKRPRSSMSPTILARDGRPVLALGSPGGSRIIGVTLAVILNVVDWGMNIQDAISFPRAYNRGQSESELEILFFDDAMLGYRCGVSGVTDDLRARGHRLAWPTRPYRAVGGVHGVMIDADGVTRLGGADPRREGVALGY